MEKLKHIYLVHVEGKIGAYKGGRNPMIAYAPQKDFIDFVKSLAEDYPEFKLRFVENEGIEEEVKQKIKEDKELEILKIKALTIAKNKLR